MDKKMHRLQKKQDMLFKNQCKFEIWLNITLLNAGNKFWYPFVGSKTQESRWWLFICMSNFGKFYKTKFRDSTGKNKGLMDKSAIDSI